MSEIRPCLAEDIPAVADLFQKTFRNARRPAPPALQPVLRELFFEHPWQDPELPSRVVGSRRQGGRLHRRPAGAHVLPRPQAQGGRAELDHGRRSAQASARRRQAHARLPERTAGPLVQRADQPVGADHVGKGGRRDGAVRKHGMAAHPASRRSRACLRRGRRAGARCLPAAGAAHRPQHGTARRASRSDRAPVAYQDADVDDEALFGADSRTGRDLSAASGLGRDVPHLAARARRKERHARHALPPGGP